MCESCRVVHVFRVAQCKKAQCGAEEILHQRSGPSRVTHQRGLCQQELRQRRLVNVAHVGASSRGHANCVEEERIKRHLGTVVVSSNPVTTSVTTGVRSGIGLVVCL